MTRISMVNGTHIVKMLFSEKVPLRSYQLASGEVTHMYLILEKCLDGSSHRRIVIFRAIFSLGVIDKVCAHYKYNWFTALGFQVRS